MTAYEDQAEPVVLDRADRELDIPTWYAVAKGARRGHYPGFVDARLVRGVIPDYLERTFYISGPQAMVTALTRMLRSIGVHRSRIRTDFFPGFA